VFQQVKVLPRETLFWPDNHDSARSLLAYNLRPGTTSPDCKMQGMPHVETRQGDTARNEGLTKHPQSPFLTFLSPFERIHHTGSGGSWVAALSELSLSDDR
jgi:hypothetical protein